MEIGIIAGCVIFAGGMYEFFRPKRRNQFNNNNFIVFRDNNGNRNILRLDTSVLNRNNSEDTINKNTKKYSAKTNMGICTISQEEIKEGCQVRELHCGHYFKQNYIDIWLSENNVCPMCRKNFKIN